MEFTYVPMILALFTLGAVFIFGISRYLKMKKELPDDHEVRPEDKIANKQSVSTHEPTPQSSPDHGTPPRQSPDQGTPPRQS